MSRSQKISSIYFTVAAICYYFSLYSLIRTGSISYTSVIGLCIGSLWMSLGALYLNKAAKKDEKKKVRIKNEKKI